MNRLPCPVISRLVSLPALWGLMLVGVLLASELAAAELRPGIPTAEGAGALAQGGRGGRVIAVTTLADLDGKKPAAGSLRAAVESSGPRIVVFQVSGLIELQAPLVIRQPGITIAGQTAPGDGICLKNYPLWIKDTHDVIVQHLRIRPGDVAGRELDGVWVNASRRVLIDHCSISWSVDEAASVTGPDCSDVTVQWCCIGEPLNKSVHAKGEHGYGSLIRTDGKVTYHHNLYVHCKTRCPRPGTYGEEPGQLDFRNNVIYNWEGPASYSAEDPALVNLVSNFYRRGPDSEKRRRIFHVGGTTTKMFLAGNVLEGDPVNDQWELIGHAEKAEHLAQPLTFPAVGTETAEAACELVLNGAGAVLPRRDRVDERYVSEVRQRTGRIINSQKEVGGWPEYIKAAAPVDSDHDGIPDSWEQRHGLDPKSPADANSRSGDGLTPLEVWLNGLD